MLKVLKYDWRSGWSSVKLTLLVAAVFSILFGFCLSFLGGQVVVNSENIGVTGENRMDTVVMILSIIWFSIMMALLVLTVDTILKNLSARMFGPEGYLTHTLPVSTWELLGGKVLGTWLFGVFMVGAAITAVFLVLISTVAGTNELRHFVNAVVELLPKLGSYHFRQIATGLGYLLYGIGAFLAWSLLLVVQLQFILIAARQFGKFHIAGGVIIFCVLLTLEGRLNNLLSMGFLVCLVSSAACFWGSYWLLQHRLNVNE